jgi:hypothetical protein
MDINAAPILIQSFQPYDGCDPKHHDPVGYYGDHYRPCAAGKPEISERSDKKDRQSSKWL